MSVLPTPASHLGEARFPSRAHLRRGSLSRAESIGDLRAMAMRRLPRFSAEYLEGGADEEKALERNRTAFDRWIFKPRVLRDQTRRDLGRTIFGRRSALPFAIGPTGFNGMLWEHGDLCLARAAAAAGIPFGQSTVSNVLAAEAAAVPGLRHWFQLYVFGPDEVWQELLRRADAAGSEAVLFTVDTHVVGNREWDRRNYSRPLQTSLRAKLDMLAHPHWLAQLWRTGIPKLANLEAFVPATQRDAMGIARWVGENQRMDLDWNLVARLRAAWPRKLLLKGIQHEDDVRRAVDSGVDGIVLSNHGGRQMDRAVAPIELVAAARAIAGPDFCILVDSGFRRGSEIMQAVALGADAVLLGRATLYGLAAGGEPGVARAIEILRQEIDRNLALLGINAVDELGPGMLFPA
jgi:(S)-mandelate dehydrogenase